jgi:hypothetical protein
MLILRCVNKQLTKEIYNTYIKRQAQKKAQKNIRKLILRIKQARVAIINIPRQSKRNFFLKRGGQTT